MAYTEKYVSPAGAGTHDGSSEANAWTFEEAIAAPVAAGCRVNVKTGTHTLTANRTLPAGTTESPIEWRGYNSTIGDLENQGRDATTGELITTNFPVIDGTSAYRLIHGGYTTLKNLIVQSSVTNGTALAAGLTGHQTERCKILQSGTGSTRAFAGTTTYGSVIDCDCVISSNNVSALVVTTNWSSIHASRVWCSNASPNAALIGISLSGIGSTGTDNVIFNVGVGIAISSGGIAARRNTWFGVANGVNINADACTIEHNVGWQHSGYAISGTTGGNPLIRNNAFGSHTSGRINTGGIGTIIEEKNPITLTADPFVDSTNKNFALNTDAAGGALCRAAARLWGGFADLGAIQSQAASGGGMIGGGNLSGGFQ